MGSEAAPGTPAAAGIGFVPLDQLASIRSCAARTNCGGRTSNPSSRLTARLDKRDVGSVNRELQSELSRSSSAGLPLGARGNYRGQQESFASLLTVLIVSAALVFLGMVQILGFSGNSTDRPHASTVEVLSVVGPMAGSGTLVAVKAQYV